MVVVPYLTGVSVVPTRIEQVNAYPFTLPFVWQIDLQFESPVTFFVGENGTGKSTLIEAIASLCRLPVSGGGRNELAGRHGPDAVSLLAPALRPAFRRRPPMPISCGLSSKRTSRHCSTPVTTRLLAGSCTTRRATGIICGSLTNRKPPRLTGRSRPGAPHDGAGRHVGHTGLVADRRAVKRTLDGQSPRSRTW
jgi:energy-coupling factor transporter ATP-binding protein EcfA2